MARFQPLLTGGALVAALVSMLCAYQLSTKVDSLAQQLEANSDASLFIENNATAFNEHIESRINAFVTAQKNQVVERRRAAWTGAPDRTESGKHIYGREDARFTLVTYSDLECPFCKRFHDTPKQVVDASNGIVNWEFKHFPLQMHNPVAAVQAIGANCAAKVGGNRSFWVFLAEVFSETKGNGQGAGNMADLAGNIGLDKDQFDTCLKDLAMRQALVDDVNASAQLGISSTPATYVVDNQTGKHQLLEGAQDASNLVAAIKQLRDAH